MTNRTNETEKVYVDDFDSKRYDVGEKLGFVTTTIELALENEEIKDELMKYLLKVTDKMKNSQSE